MPLPFALVPLVFTAVFGRIDPSVQDDASKGRAQAEGEDKAKDKDKERDEPKDSRFDEREVVTEHALRTGGTELRYRAAAGTLVLEREDGVDRASLFYVAYALLGPDGEAPDAAARPVSF